MKMTQHIAISKKASIPFSFKHIINLIGPFVFMISIFWHPRYIESAHAFSIIALAIWMLSWWIIESVPLAITSLLPLIILPSFHLQSLSQTATPYSNSAIYLFMGGFIIALGIEKWKLHRRMALTILSIVGSKANSIILGFMIASAFLSMWISNTATAVMMLPIINSVIKLIEEQSEINKQNLKKFKISLLLSVAYSCNIGGMGTLIGTPPNAIYSAYLESQYHIEVSFLSWMVFALPIVIILIAIVYFILTHCIYPSGIQKIDNFDKIIKQELSKLGKLGYEEKWTLVLFLSAALLWIIRTPLNHLLGLSISDTSIALLIGFLFFIISSSKGDTRLLDWKDTEKLPWGVLILFGGGLSLATALNDVGLLSTIAESFTHIPHLTVAFLILLLTTLMVSLTEVMSNMALATVFLPIIASIAIQKGIDPKCFAAPMILATSCVFSLPMGTPPNAIIFASGELKISNLLKVGLIMDPIAILFLSTIGSILSSYLL